MLERNREIDSEEYVQPSDVDRKLPVKDLLGQGSLNISNHFVSQYPSRLQTSIETQMEDSKPLPKKRATLHGNTPPSTRPKNSWMLSPLSAGILGTIILCLIIPKPIIFDDHIIFFGSVLSLASVSAAITITQVVLMVLTMSLMLYTLLKHSMFSTLSAGILGTIVTIVLCLSMLDAHDILPGSVHSLVSASSVPLSICLTVLVLLTVYHDGGSSNKPRDHEKRIRRHSNLLAGAGADTITGIDDRTRAVPKFSQPTTMSEDSLDEDRASTGATSPTTSSAGSLSKISIQPCLGTMGADLDIDGTLGTELGEFETKYSRRTERFTDPEGWLTRLETMRKEVAEENEFFDIGYDISFTGGFTSVIQDVCKRAIEHIAGCPLSWWPLSEPEDELKSDHVRVYSMPFRGRRFYDDIPTLLAESLFPKLANARASAFNSNYRALNREAIFLHDKTLMDLLLSCFGPRENTSALKQGRQERQSHTDTAAQSTSSSSSSRQDQVTQTEDRVDDQKRINEPVLFLTADIGLNESIARTVKLGVNDKTTIQNLHAAYQSFSPRWCWWKRATNIKFYRFHSFQFKQRSNCHCIDIHKDKERYPEKSDPEYDDYLYNPRPWPLEILPYPSREVWYYFMNPEDCATATKLNTRLPIRVNDAIVSGIRAFGIHIEERYSILAIFIPASIMVLLTLAATLWFIPLWLNDHPGDLQSATVPVTVALAVVGLFIQNLVALLIFRWTSP